MSELRITESGVSIREDVLAVSRWHRFWFHTWTRWEILEAGRIAKWSFVTHEWMDVGHIEHQRRRCLACDKSQIRTIRAVLR